MCRLYEAGIKFLPGLVSVIQKALGTQLVLHVFDCIVWACMSPHAVVPSWVVAVVLGTCFSWKFCGLGRQVTGSLAYSVTFLMYAVMMTSGLVVHCLYLVECGAQPKSQVSAFIPGV